MSNNNIRAALAAEEAVGGASEQEVSEWINSLPLWHGATKDELTGIVLRALARWGHPATPAAPPKAVITVDELADVIRGDTLDPVAHGFTPEDIAQHLLTHPAAAGFFTSFDPCHATQPAPESPAEALAARPLLEKVARLGDVIGRQTAAQVQQLAGQAAAWLRDNPPGQPVAIEPRGCPTPGACSCVEPTPPTPEQGEGGPTAVEIRNMWLACNNPGVFARAVLARWGRPTVPPGPYSEHDLRTQWNAQADEFNQWESLDSSEQLAWAQARAIAADSYCRPATLPAPEVLSAEVKELVAALKEPGDPFPEYRTITS
jgi:hypothetical protein